MLSRAQTGGRQPCRQHPRLRPHHRQPYPQHPRQARRGGLRRTRSKPCTASASGSADAAGESVTRRNGGRASALVVLAILLTVMALPLVGLFFFRHLREPAGAPDRGRADRPGGGDRRHLCARGARRRRCRRTSSASPLAVAPDRTRQQRCRRRRPLPADRAQPRPCRRSDARRRVPTRCRPRPIRPSRRSARGSPMSWPTPRRPRSPGFRLLDPARRGDRRRRRRCRPLVRRCRRGPRGACRPAMPACCASASPTSPPPPLYSVSRGTGVRVFVALPVVVDGRVAGAVYLSRTPNNIVKHLYGERGKVMLAAISILGATLLIAYVFVRTISRPMHELIDRTQAHRRRRPRRHAPAQQPRHARDGRAVGRLPRHGEEAAGALRHAQHLRHPRLARAEIAADRDPGRGRTAARRRRRDGRRPSARASTTTSSPTPTGSTGWCAG